MKTVQCQLAHLLCAFGFAVLSAAPGFGQTITGSLVGTVVDPGGLPLPGASVVVTATATQATRRTVTDERGNFFVGSLPAGTYMLAVHIESFQGVEVRDITLTAAETLSLGNIELQIASLTEDVMVTTQTPTVQIASGDRSDVIDTRQLDTLAMRGRNALSFLQLMPGVVDLQETDQIDRNFNINVQGGRRNANTVTVDGMPVNQMGNNFNTVTTLGQDAIAEVKVLLTNYPAEHGRMGGASINLISKSGTMDFRGLGSYFMRREQFNANNFFNNRLDQPKPRYRYNTWNYTIGGPIYIPGRFNAARNKLFFFWSQEYWPLERTPPVRQVTVPTALERAGDFSQSVDLDGQLITITDPITGQPFPDNRIPPDRLEQSGLALLSAFPEPNFTDRSVSGGRYNDVFQPEHRVQNRLESLKLDYHINSSQSLSFTLSSFVDQQEGAVGIPTAGAANWPQMRKTYRLHGQGYIGRHTAVITPTMVNEFGLGFTRRPEHNEASDAEIARNLRSTIGYTVPQLNPEINPLGFIPNATFGGVPNAARLFMEGRFPFEQNLKTISLSNNLTKTAGNHTLKFGFLVDLNLQHAVVNQPNWGEFSFGTDVNNRLDTGYAYANAALGVYQTYSEVSRRMFQDFRQHSVEWFAQDSWKVNRRVTLDYGMRFYYLRPIYQAGTPLVSFSSTAWQPDRQPQLIRPGLIDDTRVGVHPVTGEVYPATLIGSVAAGTGDLVNGLVVGGEDGYPRALVDGYGVLLAPRVGFAVDLFGNGRTALRGGFGTYYTRPNMSHNLGRFGNQPPIVDEPLLYYGTLATLSTATDVVFPQSVNAIDRESRMPTTMNFSLSVQHDIGWRTVLDVGYVGALGRNQMWLRNINPVPLGANFDPANADPTNPATPLPADFLRPVQGFGNIIQSEAAASSNYHSLQVGVRRRLAQGLQFGAAWTWSKTLGYADLDNVQVASLISPRVWNYGLAAFDRTHILKINYAWDVPAVGGSGLLARTLLHGWQVSGITSFVSGAPLGVSLETTAATDFTGTPSQGARPVVTGNPVLPKGERTFSRNFRTEVFQMPERGTTGDAGPAVIRGPGINNWDITLSKNVPIRGSINAQFRVELYNAFNHTQFSALDTTARFDPQGNQVNPRFGEFTAARDGRIIQLSWRVTF